MCTVVVRWAPEAPLLALALRDELVGRDFDDPDGWWPEQPAVVGGHDRTAGGSWCVTDVASGVTAFVLNREPRVAAAGAPSRGVLPLLAVRHGPDWPHHLDVTGMAGFALLLAGPEELSEWVFDGERLTSRPLPAGTHMVTSGGPEDGKADRYLASFTAGTAEQWRATLAGHRPRPDPTELLVDLERDGHRYATVFGQLLRVEPGCLDLSWSRTPWQDGTWTDRRWSG